MGVPGQTVIGIWNNTLPPFKPADNEIFLLMQPMAGVYELRPFLSFDRTLTLEIPVDNITAPDAIIKVNYSQDEDYQRFYIECDVCNLEINTETWAKYHSSCTIQNKASNLCASRASRSDQYANVTQVDCGNASKWDLFGTISPDTMANSTSNVISGNKLAGLIIGTIICTASISFIVCYYFTRCKYSKNVRSIKFAHAINN
ncbi:hypothetical protein RclHR1_04950004 [Rhizophagus clarus]|uniref:Uncharacterized protein n=1 Tax=Rhizophagus clarus TaxID=94130 RepID=A0A2Z6S2W5_9GLOM|nr:hypothetical protein RclHR1_04950004 [Rhizophagus clarus]